MARRLSSRTVRSDEDISDGFAATLSTSFNAQTVKDLVDVTGCSQSRAAGLGGGEAHRCGVQEAGAIGRNDGNLGWQKGS